MRIIYWFEVSVVVQLIVHSGVDITVKCEHLFLLPIQMIIKTLMKQVNNFIN